jgi:8-oxo-dGTP pyrophosphatase MutT (NUDIX family)
VSGPHRSPTEAHAEPLADVVSRRRVTSSEVAFKGLIWDVRRDTVALDDDRAVTREYVDHPGAVTVLALDDDERVLMIRQYRHAVRMELWELPAGLLDVAGEPPLLAAQRELAEEADLRADRWDVLADWFNSPGGNNEALRLYLARGVHPVDDADQHERVDEELDMPTRWVPLAEARDAVLAGRLHNPGAVVGILAAWAAREQGWATLRPADAPWPEHPANREPSPGS